MGEGREVVQRAARRVENLKVLEAGNAGIKGACAIALLTVVR